jgi:hypothetical protein
MIWIYLAVAFVTIALFLFYWRQARINATINTVLESVLKTFEAQAQFNAGVIERLEKK